LIISSGPDWSTLAMHRVLDPAAWAESGVPLLRDPRGLVTELHRIHLPAPDTVLLAVLDAQGRLVGSASLLLRPGTQDGWQCRYELLAQFRRIVPHGLRRAEATHTGVLMVCRRGEPGWTDGDGAWMWGLRDACTLHGLRCGAYLTLTEGGWHVLGDGRSGRNPRLGAQPQRRALRPVSTLPAPARAERQEPTGARLRPVEPSRRAVGR
jgi:hypothetical protein